MKKKSKKITWPDYEAFRRLLWEKPRIPIAHELCCHPKTLQKNPVFRVAKSNWFAGQLQRQAKASSDPLNAAFGRRAADNICRLKVARRHHHQHTQKHEHKNTRMLGQ